MSTSGGSSGGTSVLTFTVNGARLATLHASPVALLPLAGAGMVWQILSCLYEMAPGLTGYEDTTNGIGLYYDGARTGSNDLLTSSVTDMFAASQPTFGQPGVEDPGLNTGNFYTTADVTNSEIVLWVPSTNPILVGPIVTATRAAGGTGYAIGDTGTVDPDPFGGAGGATYAVATVDGITGGVLTFTITAGGDYYSTTSNPLTTTNGGAQPGIGAGFTVNVTAVPPADGKLYVTVGAVKVPTH